MLTTLLTLFLISLSEYSVWLEVIWKVFCHCPIIVEIPGSGLNGVEWSLQEPQQSLEGRKKYENHVSKWYVIAAKETGSQEIGEKSKRAGNLKGPTDAVEILLFHMCNIYSWLEITCSEAFQRYEEKGESCMQMNYRKLIMVSVRSSKWNTAWPRKGSGWIGYTNGPLEQLFFYSAFLGMRLSQRKYYENFVRKEILTASISLTFFLKSLYFKAYFASSAPAVIPGAYPRDFVRPLEKTPPLLLLDAPLPLDAEVFWLFDIKRK